MNRARAELSLYGRDGRRKYLTPSERARFIKTARAWPCAEVGTLCLMLAYSGCRISEALALDRQAIERDEACVLIRSLKKRGVIHVRAVPLPIDIVSHIDSVHRLSIGEANGRLWPWQRGRAWQLVKAVMVVAQIPPGPHATPKGLRHGFGVNAIAKLVPIHLVQRWLGHANIATTAIYLQVLGSEERAIAERMWRGD